MKPAFTSVSQALAFALLLVSLLCLPAVAGKLGWGDRRQVYSNIPKDRGPFPWIQSRIFSETADIDIAFVGSSQIMFDVNPRYVQAKLAEKLGRSVDVETIGWAWPGFDALYTIANDLLARRHVHTMVVYDEYRGDGKNHPFSDKPHLTSIYWHRWAENPEALAGLPLVSKLSVYSVAVFGTPRLLVTAARGSCAYDFNRRSADLFNPISRSGNAVEQRGSARARLVYFWDGKFRPFEPKALASSGDMVVYSDATTALFSFNGPVTPPYQKHYARKLAELCRKYGTQLIVLHTPGYRDRNLDTIQEREPPENYFGAHVPLIGISSAKLFSGISERERKLLFVDDFHLNQNGQDFFTPLITPALIKLYETPSTSL